jgi:hypothetical protein
MDLNPKKNILSIRPEPSPLASLFYNFVVRAMPTKGHKAGVLVGDDAWSLLRMRNAINVRVGLATNGILVSHISIKSPRSTPRWHVFGIPYKFFSISLHEIDMYLYFVASSY